MSARTGTPARKILPLTTIILLAGVAPVSAQQSQQAQQTQQAQPKQAVEHIVRRGDTLWGLAGHYFTNPFLWPTIFEANRDVIEDPHWIYPDEVLQIPGVESGLPVVVRQQATETVAGPAQPATTDVTQPRAGRTRFYEDVAPVDSTRAMDLAMTRLLPYAVTPSEHYSAAWLEDSTQIGVRGRLIGLADPVSQKDKLPQFLHPFDEVLLGWLRGGELVLGDSMMIVHVEQDVGTLGNIIVPVALVRIDSVSENVASALVLRQFGKATIGDHLIAAAELPRFDRVRPEPIADGPQGTLIEWIEREQIYGTLDDGFIDLGAEDGVSVGDEFVAYVPARPGPKAGMELPSEPVATLRVIKVMPNSATVRVDNASSTALGIGVHVRMVRKMPIG